MLFLYTHHLQVSILPSFPNTFAVCTLSTSSKYFCRFYTFFFFQVSIFSSFFKFLYFLFLPSTFAVSTLPSSSKYLCCLYTFFFFQTSILSSSFKHLCRSYTSFFLQVLLLFQLRSTYQPIKREEHSLTSRKRPFPLAHRHVQFPHQEPNGKSEPSRGKITRSNRDAAPPSWVPVRRSPLPIGPGRDILTTTDYTH